MNNEYNNNPQGDYTGKNVDTDPVGQSNSADSSNNIVEEKEVTSIHNENQYSYNNSGYSAYNDRTNPTNKAEQADGSIKTPKKKRASLQLIKLTAAAAAFGLIAGAAFEGYVSMTHLDKTVEDNKSGFVAEVTNATDKEETAIPTSTSSGAIITDVSDVVANVMPAIVAINSTANITSYDFFGREYNEQQQGSGSGIIIGQNDKEILIVTNNHVVEGAETVEIVFVDDKKATAVIKGKDAKSDLAVVAVDMKDISEDTAKAIKVASLGDSKEVQPGEMAIAIGNALGYGQSVTVGYISAIDREVSIEDKTMTLLQTDAAINPGNSGGALLNASGQVIGINTVKFTQTASIAVEGMGYAIPISSAVPMINELINREVVTAEEQGYLGIDATTAQNVTELYAERFNMPIGVYVNDVIEDSPAEKAGLVQGDIITGLDGATIETIDDLKSILAYKKAGQKVKLIVQVKENGAYTEKTLEVTLGDRN